MKSRVYALVISAMMLFVPPAFSSPILPAPNSIVDDPNAEVTLLSEFLGDTAIRFPDLNFEEAVRIKIGKSRGDITRNDVAGITSLAIDRLNITDLTGIEYFTALVSLYCNANQLTELDISQNTMLTVLECAQNQLTTLDVSNNAALKSLDCFGNQLTSVNVSGATALEWFQCAGNQLTTLDVSHNAALESLPCYDNQLTSLNVSRNVALILLTCFNNQLKVLDVSNNTVLRGLHCNRNRLTARRCSEFSVKATSVRKSVISRFSEPEAGTQPPPKAAWP